MLKSEETKLSCSEFMVYFHHWAVGTVTMVHCLLSSVKPGFHYPSWQPELTVNSA